MTITGLPIDALLEQERWAKKLAWDLVHDRHLADDLVQRALAAALRRPPQPGTPKRRWFAKVLRNLARNERRAKSNRYAAEFEYACGRVHGEPADHALRVLEARGVLQRAIEDLPEPYRIPVTERYVEGIEPREIARRHGVSIETVKSQLGRGREALRERLDRQIGRDRWIAALAPLVPRPRGLVVPVHAYGVLLTLAALAAIIVAIAWGSGIERIFEGTDRSATGNGGLSAEAVAAVGLNASIRRAGTREEQRTEVRDVPSDPVSTVESSGTSALAGTGSATLWEVHDGNRRRGLAWNKQGTELAVLNYSIQQVEIWSPDGRLIAFSTSSKHLNEIAVLGDMIWASHPGGELLGLEATRLGWSPGISVGDPGHHWLTNGLGVDRFDRIHVARGGDGTVQVFDPRDGSRVGQWNGLPDESQVLEINGQSFALGGNKVEAAVVEIGTGYAEDLRSFHHRPAIRLKGQLADLQFLADGSLVCLVEGRGFLRFQGSESCADWNFTGFLPLPEYGPCEADNRVERFAFGGPSGQLLAMGRVGGVTVRTAGIWETSGDGFEMALREIVSAK